MSRRSERIINKKDTRTYQEVIDSIEKKPKSKKVIKDKPEFILGEFKRVSKIKYGDKKELYNAPVEIKNGTYALIKEYMGDIASKLSKDYPGAFMNVSVKYAGSNTPISAGYFSVLDDPDIKTPYDYFENEDNYIERCYIQLAL